MAYFSTGTTAGGRPQDVPMASIPSAAGQWVEGCEDSPSPAALYVHIGAIKVCMQ